jgi:hypothetical protein
MNYEKKYLKYKQKYLSFRDKINQIGGVQIIIPDTKPSIQSWILMPIIFYALDKSLVIFPDEFRDLVENCIQYAKKKYEDENGNGDKDECVNEKITDFESFFNYLKENMSFFGINSIENLCSIADKSFHISDDNQVNIAGYCQNTLIKMIIDCIEINTISKLKNQKIIYRSDFVFKCVSTTKLASVSPSESSAPKSVSVFPSEPSASSLPSSSQLPVPGFMDADASAPASASASESSQAPVEKSKSVSDNIPNKIDYLSMTIEITTRAFKDTEIQFKDPEIFEETIKMQSEICKKDDSTAYNNITFNVDFKKRKMIIITFTSCDHKNGGTIYLNCLKNIAFLLKMNIIELTDGSMIKLSTDKTIYKAYYYYIMLYGSSWYNNQGFVSENFRKEIEDNERMRNNSIRQIKDQNPRLLRFIDPLCSYFNITDDLTLKDLIEKIDEHRKKDLFISEQHLYECLNGLLYYSHLFLEYNTTLYFDVKQMTTEI